MSKSLVIAGFFSSFKAFLYRGMIKKTIRKSYLRSVKELAEKEGITEAFKAENQMLWMQRMNAVREIATEIVNNDLIYA